MSQLLKILEMEKVLSKGSKLIPQLWRSDRVHCPSCKYPSSEYILLNNEGEPESFEDPNS